MVVATPDRGGMAASQGSLPLSDELYARALAESPL